MKTCLLLTGLSSLGLFLSACTSTAVAGPPTDMPGRGPACAPAGQRLAALSVKPGEAEVDRVIAWSPQVATDSHRLVENRRVTGPCAKTVKAFLVNTAVLESGEGFDFGKDGSITSREPADLLKPVTLAGPPPQNGGQFLMATRVGYRREAQALVSDYLGLWREGDRWTVASFSQRGALNTGPVKPVLTSTLPVEGVTYFPSLDTPSGQIALTLRETPLTTTLLSFSWRHSQWFQ